jgi:transposase-like protein
MEPRYRVHHSSPQIISYAFFLHYRFTLSLRDVEDLLAERGIVVFYKPIRRWCQKYVPIMPALSGGSNNDLATFGLWTRSS